MTYEHQHGHDGGQKFAPRVKIGGLYAQKRQRDGAFYLAGRFGWGVKMTVMPNPNKVEDDSQPDYEIFIQEQPPKADTAQ